MGHISPPPAQSGTSGASKSLPAPAVSANAANRYDPARNLYNLAGNLRRFRAALAGAMAGTGLCQIMCGPGDSTTGGNGAVRSSSSYPAVLRSILASAGLPMTGTGIVPAGAPATADTRWVLGAGWTAGQPHATASTNGAILTFTADQVGTVVNVWYSNQSGPFTVAIDGAAPVTVTPTLTNAISVYQVTGLQPAAHQVVITTTSATTVNILAAECRGTTGVTVSNFGITGSTTNSWLSTGFGSYMNYLLGVPADLYLVALGVNDQQGSVAFATFQSNLNTILTSLAGSDVALVIQNPTNVANLGQAGYEQSTYALADSVNVPLVDLTDRWGSYASANGLGMMSDTVHPSIKGYADIASAIATLVEEGRPPLPPLVPASILGGCDMISGRWYARNEDQSTAQSAGNGIGTYEPLVVTKQGTVAALCANVTVGGSAGAVVRMGIYGDLGGLPGPLLLDAGTVVATGTGVVTISGLTTVLPPGRYWKFVVTQGAPATSPTLTAFGGRLGQIVVADTTANALGFNSGWYSTGVTGALPQNPTLNAQASFTYWSALQPA